MAYEFKDLKPNKQFEQFEPNEDYGIVTRAFIIPKDVYENLIKGKELIILKTDGEQLYPLMNKEGEFTGDMVYFVGVVEKKDKDATLQT